MITTYLLTINMITNSRLGGKLSDVIKIGSSWNVKSRHESHQIRNSINGELAKKD